MSVPQLIKWIGNKTKYSNEIVSLMPEEINTYIEPFLGSGAVLATLLQHEKQICGRKVNKAIASDSLAPLIGIFQLVKDDPEKIIEYYSDVITKFYNDRNNIYLEVRDRFNQNQNPFDFLILSRTCYSGVIRFRKNDGYMSTPIGPHKPISPEAFRKRAEIWSQLLKKVDLYNEDYREIIKKAGPGDLIYCDPPYTHSQSILYGAQAFNIDDLWTSIREAKNRGAKIMLSLNGKNKSEKNDISTPIPVGLFERNIFIDCGISMINRLQKSGEIMEEEQVHDMLLLTW